MSPPALASWGWAGIITEYNTVCGVCVLKWRVWRHEPWRVTSHESFQHIKHHTQCCIPFLTLQNRLTLGASKQETFWSKYLIEINPYTSALMPLLEQKNLLERKRIFVVGFVWDSPCFPVLLYLPCSETKRIWHEGQPPTSKKTPKIRVHVPYLMSLTRWTGPNSPYESSEIQKCTRTLLLILNFGSVWKRISRWPCQSPRWNLQSPITLFFFFFFIKFPHIWCLTGLLVSKL